MSPEKNISTPGAGPNNSKNPFEKVADLVSEYGGVAKVPDEVLEEHGYSRRDDGTLAPIDLEVKKISTIEEKNAEKPFEAFEVTLKGSKSPRHIDYDVLQTIHRLELGVYLFSLGAAELDEMASKETVARAKQLKIAMMQAGSINPVEQALRGSCLYSLTDYFPRVEYRTTEAEAEPSHHILSNLDPYSDSMPRDEVLRLQEAVERERGVFADVDEIYKQYDSLFTIHWDTDEFHYLLDKDPSNLNIDREYELEKLEATLNSLGIESAGQYIMYMVGKLLDETFPGSRKDSFAVETIKVRGMEEMANYLLSVEQEQIELLRGNLRDAKANLKLTPFGDANRQAAETRLKEAKDSIKEVNIKLLPLREAFERPIYVSRMANKAYDKLSEALMGGTDEELVLRFVSDVDEQLDRNPGVISGDCTAGAPLPFLAPNQLYNVKVFRGSQHIGNIYLLQVVDEQTQKPYAWHLDAIQIPLFTDWTDAAARIIEALKQKASLKGVEHITINYETHHISNYDYIAEAFQDKSEELGYWNSKLTDRIRNVAKNTVLNEGTQLQAANSLDYREL